MRSDYRVIFFSRKSKTYFVCVIIEKTYTKAPHLG